ncbi:transglutaminase-like domain-containing protein, partial [Geothermobacter hydrogeniphilus]
MEWVEAELGAPAADMKKLRKHLDAKRKTIEALDAELRLKFAQTEKWLKNANLPAEILDRHYRFVKHYDANLEELKGNIVRIEKAKNMEEAEAEIEKTKKQLKRVKRTSKHRHLDPDKLPNRQPKAKKREPRMEKEEFERDFKKDNFTWRNQKRILVASAGSLDGLLLPDDLAETIEVPFTPEIRTKAAELGNSPLRIYEWVRNNIEFVPTWGSIQGAQMTLETRQGNAFDTASLLIALLRAAGVKARYVMGTIELPIEKVMNWAGDFTDPMSALDFFSSGGIPTKGLVDGGRIVAARMEHVWVEAYIDYFPSRGAKHKEGDTWISLDPSFKQYTYSDGIDIRSAVPFDAQTFLDQVQATATIDEAQGYATGVDALLVQQTLQDYQTRVQDYIQQTYPDATVGDVLGRKEIVRQEFPFLLGTLPYRTAVKGATFAAIPDAYRHKLTFHVENEVTPGSFVDPTAPAPADTSLRLTMSLPELAGKKITLSYSPATAQDEAVLEAYLPKPHADGTPIQPSELPSSLPAYLINVKPELRIDGQVVATGAPVGLGGTNIFTMTFSDPSYGSTTITNYLDAGVFQAIGLNLGRISPQQLTNLKAGLEATRAKLENQDFTGLTKDQLVGDLLYTTAIAYHAELSIMNAIAARTMGVNALTLPSETIFATKLKVLTLWGIPRLV